MKLSKRQHQMLVDIYANCEPTDFAEYADRADALGWRNRERVLDALSRKGLLENDDIKLTEAGMRLVEQLIEASK